MSDKKLLLVSTSFPMKKGDGLSPFIWELGFNLKYLGWDVTALVPHHKGLPDREVWDGVTIRRFRYLPERFEDVGYSGGIMPNIKKKPWRIIKLPFYICSMYREALRIAIDENFDIISFQWLFPASFWLGQFVRSSGLPVVMTGHGTDIHLATKGIFRRLSDRAMKHAAALTVNSNYMKGLLSGNKLPAKTEVIFMGVDTEKFRPGKLKPSDSKTILYVGRLIKQKGIDLLVEAFVEIIGEIPDARLEIIGYGPEKEHILEILKTNKVERSVIITEMVPHDSLPEIYGRARILTLPALIPEGLGITPAEAGLAGVPTVTFGLGGTSELIINGKTGLIVEPTRDGLKSGLLTLLRNGDMADQMGQNAREHLVNIIGWSNIAAKFDLLFKEVINSHQVRQIKPKTINSIITILIAVVSLSYLAKLFVDRFQRLMGFFK